MFGGMPYGCCGAPYAIPAIGEPPTGTGAYTPRPPKPPPPPLPPPLGPVSEALSTRMVRPSNLAWGVSTRTLQSTCWLSESRWRRSSHVLLNVVHGRYGLLSIILVGVTNETESSAAASVAVLHHHLGRGGTHVSDRHRHRQMKLDARGGGYRESDHKFKAASKMRTRRNILLLQPHRTLQTSVSEYPPLCARQGRCTHVGQSPQRGWGSPRSGEVREVPLPNK